MILIFLNLGVSVFCFAPPAQISKKSSAPSAPLNKKIAKFSQNFPGWSVLGFLIPKKLHRPQKSKDPEILISEILGGANDVCSTNGAGFLEMFVGRPPSHFLVVFPPLEVQGWISSPKNP